MPSFFVNTSLGRGDLSLFLRNEQGLLQDGYDVSWSVYKRDGRPSSGQRIPAAKAGPGEYYAPWGCSHAGGCYSIQWQYRATPGGVLQTARQDFFVIDVSTFCPCPTSSSADTSCGAYFSGQPLGPNDLHIVILDDDGLPAAAYAVWWSIVDSCGRCVVPRTPATAGASVGDYYASWVACGFGEYKIRWEWMLEQDSPLESSCQTFSVLSPPAVCSTLGSCVVTLPSCCAPAPPQSCGCGPTSLTVVAGSAPAPYPVFSAPCCSPAPCPPSPCPPYPPVPPVPPIGQCCDVEVPRVVHLETQVLPLGGAFTNQASYAVPARVRHIAFYVTYRRAVPGGFPVIRLFWGNGVEETQATLINQSILQQDGQFASQAMRLSDLVGPVPDTDSPVTFLLETAVPGGSTTVRLLAAEGGVVGLPGTAGITLTASS